MPEPQAEEITLEPYPVCGNETNADLIDCEIKVRAWGCMVLAQFNAFVLRSTFNPATSRRAKLLNVPAHCRTE